MNWLMTYQNEVQIGMMMGVYRARHTFAAFFKCYHRATVLRVKVAFLAVKATGLELRFEDAAML
jgi:hypothetical protein